MRHQKFNFKNSASELIRNAFIKKRLEKKSRFSLELNEIPNEDGRFATAFVSHFLNTVLLN
ncbi:hypothetical protein FC25_GL000841 [Ligilactobacillus ruminis DSM 20403 = NBRC 102161]|nr:hypothetical protein FC25_GL000841 [Ligilactobacillus ruminis DSM 20403 = NBRC 102161]